MLRTNKENFAKCRIAQKCLKKRFRVIPTSSDEADTEPNTDSLGFLLVLGGLAKLFSSLIAICLFRQFLLSYTFCIVQGFKGRRQ